MASISDFRRGMVINYNDDLYLIVEFQHVKISRGKAMIKTKLKNVKTGQVVEETFRAGEKVEIVRIEARDYTYSYFDGEFYVFMDNETFEQISLSNTQVEDVLDFLIENTTTTIAFNGDEPVEVRIPQHMNLIIAETDPGEKGNTAQGGTKPAKLETGVIIQVPLFIQEGEKIRIDTKDRRYIERVKE